MGIDQIFKGHTVMFTDKEQRQRMSNDVDRYKSDLSRIKSEIKEQLAAKKALEREGDSIIRAACKQAKSLINRANDKVKEIEKSIGVRLEAVKSKEAAVRIKADKVAQIMDNLSGQEAVLEKKHKEVKAGLEALAAEEKRIETEVAPLKVLFEAKIADLAAEDKRIAKEFEEIANKKNKAQELINSSLIQEKTAQAYIEQHQSIKKEITAFMREKEVFRQDKQQLLDDREFLASEKKRLRDIKLTYQNKVSDLKNRESAVERRERALIEKQRKLRQRS